ncbi:MAG: hemin ABC transporter substrate-binding protein [Nevskiaceae bacterium]|nr:MAG: hemin ABC transporter substrate-binding protein [Nevskiaceae bacterium]TBR73246.1 MAG: hemin ABC transporter substrate-binding protein [Nevskiaceae bacterium]
MWLERCSLSGLVLLLAAGSAAATASETTRVVVAGGGLTEILYALGVEDRIVGVDTTSTWPAAAQEKPQVGYLWALAAEGILSLSPTLVITTSEAGPATSLNLVAAAGVPVRELPAPRSAQGVEDTIRTLAVLFDREEAGERLIGNMTRALHDAEQQVTAYPHAPRVLFVLAANTQLMAGGHDTAADAMIRLAGGVNVADYAGYRPLTPEATARLAPDVILTVDYVVKESGSPDKLLARPALSLTPAARHRRLVAMEAERLLGFGPRLGETVAELARLLHAGMGS